jgi:hypothetical protein
MLRLHKIGLLEIFVFDEAHKIAEWGKTFRPEFNETYKLRSRFLGVPILVPFLQLSLLPMIYFLKGFDCHGFAISN